MVRLGYNSNGFAHTRLDEALELLSGLGYQAVALTPDVGCLDPATTDRRELERIGALCARLKLLPVVETGARFILDPRRKHRPNLLEPDESSRVRLEFLEQMTDWAAALGAPVLSFWSGALPAGQSPDGARNKLADALDRLHAKASGHGVTLALEPEPGHWIATLDDYAAFKQSCPDRFRLSLDVGHLLVTQEAEPHDAVRVWRDEIASMQLDDMRRGVHEHLPPGEGELDWRALAAAVSSAGLDVPACFELSRDSHRFHELAPAAMQHWRQCGGT